MFKIDFFQPILKTINKKVFFQKFILIILIIVILLINRLNYLINDGMSMVLEGKTMGTIWRVSLVGVENKRRIELQKAIQNQLDLDEDEISTWKNKSVLSQFNQYQGNQPKPISANIADLIIKGLRIANKTNGAMNILIGPLVNLWGFGPTKEPIHIPHKSEINTAKKLTELQYLRVIQSVNGQWLQKDMPGIYVDLSTMGEGYATDNLAGLMERFGVTNYLVSVGGAVVSAGLNSHNKAWQVAIQKPIDYENIEEARVNLRGHGISTSGSYRNYYELDGKRISHIIDPRTGSPIDHNLVSATVISTTALEADAWDTGLMVLGEEGAKSLALKEHLAVYLISRKGNRFTHWMSPQFKSFLIYSTKNHQNLSKKVK